MKKMIKRTRAAALAMSSLLLAATAAGGIAAIPTQAASYNNTYSLDVAKSFQEFDGWGLSLSWWATEIGDWTRTGSSGMQKREEVMEAIYGESGLNLNIARYNVGGGDDPAHTHMTDDRNTPGWRGAQKITVTDAEDNEYPTYLVDKNYYFTADDGSTLSWDQTPDWRQLWVLDWIQSTRDDVITEYYSNSPPYWMTITGCSSGGVGAGANLDPVNNQLFVDYFLDVYEYLVSQGFTFENLQPFNESGSYYWGENGDQEGCYFSADQKVEILYLLAKGMEERGIDANYNFGDETNVQNSGGVAQDQYKKALAYTNGDVVGADVVNGASRLTYHIYSYDVNGAQQMYRNAKSNGQEIYMSEICYTSGDEYDPEAMSTGFLYTQSILDTVKYGGVDAYVFWQGVEDMVGQMKSGTNYGLIQGVYYTQEEAEAQGYDLAAMGLNYQDFVLSKAYYMSGQYTKYIQQGYTLIDIDDSGSMAAISPDGQTVVVIKQNNSSSTDSFKLNLGGFKANSVEKIVTDQTHNWAKTLLSTDGESIIDTVSASSITTYVIHGTRSGSAGYFIDDSWADTSYSSIDQIQAKLDELGETEQFYGTYNIASHDCSANYYFGTSYTNATNWMVFRFKGTGFALPFVKKSNAGTLTIWVDTPTSEASTATVNLYSSSTVAKGIVYEDRNLEDGWHTVYVQSGYSNILMRYVNFDGAFLYTARDADTSGKSLEVTNAAGLGGQVKFDYTAQGYDGYEFYAEYRAQDQWTRVETALTDGSATIAVDAEQILLRVAAVKDEEVLYSPAQVVNVLKTTEGVLYFADCGTGDPNALNTGAVLGTLQSASDQPYGADAFTGKSWGYTNTLKSGATATGFYTSDEAMTSMMTVEYVNEAAIEYLFTIPEAGTYNVALGFFGGGTGWGSRNETITVQGQTASVTLAEGQYTAKYFTVTTTQADEAIAVAVAKPAGESQDSLLSLIAITEEGVKLPLYASLPSNLNTQTTVSSQSVYIGENIYEKVAEAEFALYYVDGSHDDFVASNSGVSYTVTTGNIVVGGTASATFTVNGLAGVEAYATYTWMQDGAEVLYYNIDCGYTNENGTPPVDPGIYQSSAHDLAEHTDAKTGTTWGYSGSAGTVRWENDGAYEWSIRGEISDLTYVMTGFNANELLKIMIGGHISNWGDRTCEVQCNGVSIGDLPLKSDERTSATFMGETVRADAEGKITLLFKNKSGGNPSIGYIKVWSRGDVLPKDTTITADKTIASRGGEAGKITLRNLNTNATVYIYDEYNAILGSFVPTATTAEITVSDYLPESSYELHFVQATANVTSVSDELVVSVPGVEYTLEREWVQDGFATVIRFMPHASNGVTSLTLTTPDGVTLDLTEGFFYRAKVNGEYTVKMVSGSSTVESTFLIENIDTLNLNETFSTTEWTKNPVTVTLRPEATSGIAAVTINGTQATATDGVYTITATENGVYEVSVTTQAGYTYHKSIAIGNIDQADPAVDLYIDYSVVAGVSLGYEANAVSGGTLYVSYNGGEREEVTDPSAFSLEREGKYEITFTNGAGSSTQTQVYYVTYGTEKAQLATVTLSKNGTVSVADKARATVNATLYRSGESSPLETLNAEKAGKYYLEIEKDGETEIVIFNVAANVSGTGIADETGGSAGAANNGVMIAGIVVGCAAIVAAGAVCVVLVMKGRKKQ